MSDLDLMPTEVSEDLRATVRDLLADRCDPGAVAACWDGDRSVVALLWRALACDLGLSGLLVAEEHGGHGATAREAGVVLEELGAAAAPVPFLTSAVIATTVLADTAGTVPAARDLLGRLAAGDATAALVVPFPTGPGQPLGGASGSFSGRQNLSGSPLSGVSVAQGRLTGRVTSVAGALEADVLLLPVRTGTSLEVHAVESAAADLTAVTSLDMGRQLADVELAGATGTVVVPGDTGEAAVRRGLRLGAALLASEQAGLARWCLETTVAHLKERRQFGRVVGGFQALKHRLADLFVDAEGAGAAAVWAAATLADTDTDTDTDEADLATAVAASWCSDVAVAAAEEAVQLHGGIGMTWEHPVHLRLKRAKADQVGLGSPEHHRCVVARLADLPGPGAVPTTTEETR